MKLTAAELKSIINGSIASGNECMARGAVRAAQIHFETADAFATELSLLNIREGRGI